MNEVNIDFFWLAVILAIIFLFGSPDLLDAVIFKLTGVKGW